MIIEIFFIVKYWFDKLFLYIIFNTSSCVYYAYRTTLYDYMFQLYIINNR